MNSAMIEVFRTNVNSRNEADLLAGKIHETFESYLANFDLEDCDKILRIETAGEHLDAKAIINLVNQYGFMAEAFE